jgi:four helix bundle protein
MKISSYKELEAYKKGFELVKIIYEMTKSFPHEEMYGLTSQIRRAAISIPSNIAEGYMRGTKEYIQFLKISLGSCAELETQLSLCKEIGYCKIEVFQKAYDLNLEITKLLLTYIKRMSIG